MAKLKHFEVLFLDGEIQEFYVTKQEVIYTMIGNKKVKEIKEI